MPRVVQHRQVTPAVKIFRDICRGKPVVEALRYADGLAARVQPPPTVPGGPYHKTSKVYYYSRDARRLVQPPVELFAQKQIGAGRNPVRACRMSSLAPRKRWWGVQPIVASPVTNERQPAQNRSKLVGRQGKRIHRA